jgi:hypothetical protein
MLMREGRNESEAVRTALLEAGRRRVQRSALAAEVSRLVADPAGSRCRGGRLERHLPPGAVDRDALARRRARHRGQAVAAGVDCGWGRSAGWLGLKVTSWPTSSTAVRSPPGTPPRSRG